LPIIISTSYFYMAQQQYGIGGARVGATCTVAGIVGSDLMFSDVTKDSNADFGSGVKTLPGAVAAMGGEVTVVELKKACSFSLCMFISRETV
uniref:CYTOSOL_AP domain-containing protein n=1 Tax=Haemonchus placei TaxID=6290 RepID=A0A0N4W7K2_HAEPC